MDDWPLLNLPDIIKICVYCNLLYYREIRYLIANKYNQSFLNFDIQRRLTEHAYKRNVNLLSSSCRNMKIKFCIWFRTVDHKYHRRKPTTDYASFLTPSPWVDLYKFPRFHEYSLDRIIQSD